MDYISKKLTLEEIKIRLKEINPNIEIISNKYINNKTKLKFKCLADGCNYIGNMNWTHLRDGHGCKKCSLDKIRKLYSIPKNGNSVFEMRPDLYKFFYNKDECHNYSVFSGFKIQCICPICGKLKDKKIKILDLSKQGFSCGYCSDGISIPEKFMRNVLKQINVDFTVQYSPSWANKKDTISIYHH